MSDPRENFVISLLEAFGLGLLSSFTPCVFPLIPITIALFGARETTSKIGGFTLGLSYVMGIAFTYTLLGMLSAKLGLVFGAFLGRPWVLALICAFLFILILQTLEIIELKFLSAIQTKAGKVGGKGLGGAFLMGTVSGFVAAPCIGPALVLILGLAAKSQSATWGAALLFSYSLGLGLIFLVLATFSGLLKLLPKSGSWLNGVKFILAVLLITVVIFLGERYLQFILVELTLERAWLLLTLNSLGIFLAWISYRGGYKLLRLAAAIMISLSLYCLIVSPSATMESAAHSSWLTDFDQAVETGRTEGKIVFVDLYADWCVACKEFERITFKDPRVIEKLKSFITVRVDFTDTTTPLALRLTEKYEVPGLPYLIFLKADGSGDIISNSTITGFLGAEDFLTHLEAVQDGSLPKAETDS